MKNIAKFFQAFANVSAEIRQCADLAWLDLFPQTTTRLSEWLQQFGLKDSSSQSDQEKRNALAAAWQANGSLSPKYLQDTLQGLGFDVYVHEWWEPGTEPPVGVQACATARNPLLYLDSGSAILSQDGEPLMMDGEPDALDGNPASALGYPLVNLISLTLGDYTTQDGEPLMIDGEPFAEDGGTNGYVEIPLTYSIPADSTKWPYFVYIGGQTFPNTVSMAASKRAEFESALLKYCPAHLWIGVLVFYT